ncbi:MAG: TlpA disulfide reductase family protein [Pseudorhodoplanes sp.]|uniref:TlpA disulfide reductase family protein n=1 Tax=Pseudorhodoplanes sp. TaxID=1934341 RepID=UPI003D139A7F
MPDDSHSTPPRLSRRGLLRGTAASAVAAAPAFASGSPPPMERYRIVRPARNVGDFPMVGLDGSTSRFSRFRGKVVLMNLWATWCPACRVELPALDRLQQTMGRSGLQVIAVSVDRGDRRAVQRYVRDRSIRNLPVFVDPEARIAHSEGSADRNAPFALYGMPISYVISRSGDIQGYVLGEADWTSDAARNLLTYYLQHA